MTTYARMRTLIESADNASFLRPRQYEAESLATTNADETTIAMMVDAPATISLAHLTTCFGFVFKNDSPTISVFLSWRSIVGSCTNPGGAGFVIADANPDTITDATARGIMITSGGEVGGIVVCQNSEDPLNNNAFFIQAITPDVITVINSTTLTVNAQDTSMNIVFMRRNKVLVSPGGIVSVCDSVDCVNIITAVQSGTVPCVLSYIGT